MTRPVSARRPRDPGDPYGIGPLGPFVAPALALVGLLVVALATFGLMGGNVSFPGTAGPGGPNNPGGGPGRTAAPSDVVIIDPRTEVPGSIVYAKAGNL